MAKFAKGTCVINDGDRDNPARECGTIVAEPQQPAKGEEPVYLVQWPSLPSPIEELEADLAQWESQPGTASQSA
ncbi:hypothetical protein [Amycolatopsis sp. NPDC004079]|uniref:hypothetical protein n=1 Tax=Amycolatopsis sp. NPDC004079 TaxID=3154549 RepID=UPI0033B2D735